jgi:hypothetical protein
MLKVSKICKIGITYKIKVLFDLKFPSFTLPTIIFQHKLSQDSLCAGGLHRTTVGN